MRGFQPAKANKAKAQYFANGGAVRGKGTGTSDEVPQAVPEGTYIMPADSTAAVGEQALAQAGQGARGFSPGSGEKVPVNLSNGEFKLPPEQVHAVGVQALDQIKNATHAPVAARGFAPGAVPVENEQPRMFFANGGVVDEEARRNAAIQQIPTGGIASPQRQPPAAMASAASAQPAGQPLDAQAAADRAKIGAAWDTVKDVNDSAGRAIADVATMVPRGLAGAYDSAVVRPMRAAGVNASYLSPSLVPNGVDPSSMTPFTDQKRMQQQPAAAAQPAKPGYGAASADFAGPPAPAAGEPNTADAPLPRGGSSSAAQPGYGPIGDRTTLTNEQAAIMNPAGRVTMTRGANGNMEFSGNNVSGQVSYNDANGKAFAGGGLPMPGGGSQGFANFSVAPAGADVATGPNGSYAYATSGSGVRGLRGQGGDAGSNGGRTTDGIDVRGLSGPAADQYAREVRQAQAINRSGPSSTSYDPARERERKALVSALTTALPEAQGITAAQRQGLLALQAQEANQTQARVNNDVALEQTQMQASTQRDIAAMREAGESGRAGARNAIDQGRLGLEQQVRGFDVLAGERQEKLHQKYEAAKTPEEKSAIAQQIRDLSGKQQDSPWKVQVTPATKNADGSTTDGSIYRYNTQTGEVERADAAARGAPPAAPQESSKRVVGQTYTAPNGKTVKWTVNGWVPQ